MKRSMVLGVILGVGVLTMMVSAYQGRGPQGPKVAEIEKVKDNLYLLHGQDGGTRLNMTAFVTATGVVVVDTGFPGWGQTWLATLKSVTNKPVTTIINTHTHADHTGSNPELGANLEIVAHETTKTNMAREKCATVGGCQNFQGENAKYLPNKTFKDKLSLFSGNDRIDLYYFGRAHTGGDAVVVYPALRAASTGDLFAWRGVPRIMTEDGGSGLEFPRTLAKAQSGIKDVDILLTGHGKVMAWKDWQDYRDFLTEFVAQVQAANKSGKTLDEALAGLKLEKYKVCDPKSTVTTELQASSECVYRMDQARADAQIIYDELKK